MNINIDLFIKKLGNNNVLLNESMAKHTSFKTGGNADVFVKVKNKEELEYILKYSRDNNIPIFILGNGSNILVRDNGIRGIVCKMEMTGFNIIEKEGKVFATLGSGNKNAICAQKFLEKELTGFEFASGIPGTIGGAIKMNAGAYGQEMKDIVFSTTYISRNGEVKTIYDKEHEFDYRRSFFSDKDFIILETTIMLKKGNKSEIKAKMQEFSDLRKQKQPYDMPSAGSTFKRGKDFITASIIDQCGLKGMQIGGAKVSEKHAGFIVNNGDASTNDILELIDNVKKIVFEKTGKKIELEIEVVGEE